MWGNGDGCKVFFFFAGFLSMGGELNEMVVKIKKKT